VVNRQLYREGETIQKTIPKRGILKIENNVKKQEIKHRKNIKHISKLLEGYLPINWEEADGSSARHSAVLYSTVQYMVLAVLDG
jgi:hypothetical protein